MTIDDHTEGLEESVSIDAAPADIFAVLTAGEPVLTECSGLTVSTGGEDVTVTDAGAEGASPSVFGGQVRVTDSEEPTSLTMSFDGATECIVKWTLQPEEDATLVTAAVTDSPPAPDRDGPTGGETAQVTDSASSASDTARTATLNDMLETLQTLCEQPSPPACIVERVEITEISCPFSAEINPHLEEIIDHTYDWVQEMGLTGVSPTKLDSYARFSCWVNPVGPPETINLCNDWYCFLYLHDDHLDTTGQGTDSAAVERFQEPFLAVLDGEPPDSNQVPLVEALADICQRATAIMSQEWCDRFVQCQRDYFEGTKWEVDNLVSNHVPGRHAYIPNRRHGAALYPSFAMSELERDISLSTDVYHREDVTALRESAANIIAWSNDVFSLQRELVNDRVSNLIVTIREEQGCSLQEAVTEVCELIEAEIRRFEALSHRIAVASDTDADLLAYRNALKHWISGYLEWCKESPRFETSHDTP
ncbi:terpene synthase family protein [Natrialba taiwanensis]|uniref:Terpene synthase metal-binding domain-containing protein n=1 Tax=Natrialba taiwanensis DSM 12281 TaxID=1230458 RepID=M0A3Y4_9EURY|nr:hypothetical protein [Natrialba taiwanensis]ELY92602.1 terpene synthase metal-binding domain-containing protein [Natrialba taiwanensis DSM 12281]